MPPEKERALTEIVPQTSWFRLRPWIARHPVASFLIMAYAVTALTSLSPTLTRRDLLPYGQAPYDLLAHLFGSAVPALVVVSALRGRAGARDLVQRSLRWRVEIKWYLIALLAPTVFTVLTAFALTGRDPLAAAAKNWPVFLSGIIPSLLFAFVLSNTFEEIGWMGFLQDREQGRHHPFAAAVIAGVAFSLGHLPGFIVEGGSFVDGLIILGVLFVPQLASRVIAGWFYNNTNRSLLIVGLFHASYNATTQDRFAEAFLPVSEEIRFAILVGVPVIAAILVAAFTKGRLGYRPMPDQSTAR